MIRPISEGDAWVTNDDGDIIGIQLHGRSEIVDLSNPVNSKVDPVTGKRIFSVGGVDSGVISQIGVYNYDPTDLKKFRRAIARVRAGVADAKHCAIGDSTDRGSVGGTWPAGGYGTAWPQRFAAMLNSYLVPASCDNWWCSGSLRNAEMDAYETRLSRGAWFTDVNNVSAGGNTYKTSSGGTSAFVFTPAGTWDTVDIYLPVFAYNGSTYANNGTLSFQIDGAAPASGPSTFNTNTGVAGLQKITLTASAVGTHALKILQDSRAGYQGEIAGLVFKSSAQKRVLVQNMGWAGSRPDNWTANEAVPHSPLSALRAVAPDLTSINLSINTTLLGQSVAAWSADVQKIITAAKESGDVILRIGNPTSGDTAHPDTSAAITAAAHDLAKTNGLLLIDLRERWGAAADAVTAGLLGADVVHPEIVGYCDIAQSVFEPIRSRI